MKTNEITYNENEQIITTNQNIKVEIKGLGPTIKVFKKCKIIVTNERISISQKMLFSSKYIVQYIIWFGKSDINKYTLKGMIETSMQENKINEIDYKGKKITELYINNKFIEYIRIFAPKDILFNS